MVWIHNGSPELDHISQYQTIIGVCISLSILTTAVVALRAFTRARILKVLGIDDYVIFFSCICAIIYSGLCIGQSRWGLGLDIKLRPRVNINDYSIINFVGRPFYMTGILGFKVALCFAYLRIMRSSTHTVYKAITWVIMITCIIGHVAGTLVLIFQCKPIRKSWLPLTKGYCMPNDATFYGLAAVTIFFDVVIFFLPIPLLLRLNISKKKKFALVWVFLLGLLTTVCSVLRMVQIATIAQTGNSTMLVLWGVIELNMGIILTCIPTLGPLFPYFRGSTVSHTHTADSRRSRYQLPNLSLSRNARNTSHVPNAETAGFDKFGESTFGTDSTTTENKSGTAGDSGSEDMVTLRDHMAHTPRVQDDIIRTTDIRVSVDVADADRGVERGNVARAW